MFLCFLVKCILQVDPESWPKFDRFPWWPIDIPWNSYILSEAYRVIKFHASNIMQNQMYKTKTLN